MAVFRLPYLQRSVNNDSREQIQAEKARYRTKHAQARPFSSHIRAPKCGSKRPALWSIRRFWRASHPSNAEAHGEGCGCLGGCWRWWPTDIRTPYGAVSFPFLAQKLATNWLPDCSMRQFWRSRSSVPVKVMRATTATTSREPNMAATRLPCG